MNNKRNIPQKISKSKTMIQLLLRFLSKINPFFVEDVWSGIIHDW